MDRVHFTINGEPHSGDPRAGAYLGQRISLAIQRGNAASLLGTLPHGVGSDVASNMMLVDYIRECAGLHGTKFMCREGGCGACVVAVVNPARSPRPFAVNSCLVAVWQCSGWRVRTVEGLGGRRQGYHPVQRALADHNGTQCGHCSPGFVMEMYSLLETRGYSLSEYDIEDGFASNVCRCTGYRPILEAFKTFASTSSTITVSDPDPTDVIDSMPAASDAIPSSPPLPDIEDLSICTHKTENCKKTCKRNTWCWVDKKDLEVKPFTKIVLHDDRVLYRVTDVTQIFDILNTEGTDSYMLVGGNTGRGAFHILEFPRVLIELRGIADLNRHFLDQNLVVGASTSLTELMQVFLALADKREEFAYLRLLYDHLNLVAHIPVRNIGTIAGNLMVKHRAPTFSSDVFLLFETIGATLTIMNINGKNSGYTPEEFLHIDMTGKLIINVKIPPFSHNYRFVSFKIMPRAQNAAAQVNAAFLYQFGEQDKDTVVSARIVMGGLSAKFVHAKNTEKFVVGKKIFTNEILQEALKVLESEIIVEEIPGELKPVFRKKLALGLFYKGLLTMIPDGRLSPRYRSGARDLRKSRAVSRASEVYDTNPLVWPLTEPTPKVEALVQCAGELRYCNDLPRQPRETHAAFVTADIGRGDILSIDPSPALKLPGVISFISAKDIPGKNNFMSLRIGPPIITAEEEILCSGDVKYYDQAIGIIVAESVALAHQAALLVQVKYRVRGPPVLEVAVARRDPARTTVFLVVPARARGADVQRVLTGSTTLFGQYHYTMETISCLARPSEDGIEVFPSSHWPDLCHVAIADALNIKQNRINLQIGSLGGSYGSRLTRATQVVTACALVTYLLDRPCRFVMSIQANMRIIGKRMPCLRDFEVGINNEGEIQYLEYHLYEDNGYILSEPIIFLAVGAIKNCYDNQRWQYKLFNVITDTTSNTWCRAPGSLEAIAMTEYIMEQISYELDRDPLEVRMKNLTLEDSAIRDLIANLIKDAEYYKRKEETKQFNQNNRWKKRGLRVALMSWSSVIISDYQVLLSVFHGDGTVVVQHGGIENGQGVNTKVIQAVAFALKLSLDKVKVKPLDVVSNPNSLLTGSSRTTETVCYGAIKCCQLLLDRLAPLRESLGSPAWEVLVQAAWRGGINLQTSYHTTSNDSQVYRAAGAALAEIELDVLTGEHHVLRVDLHEDVGTSMNPEIDVGQIEGAFIMGLGYWTSEHLIYDQKTGELLTDRTWNYHVPQAKDIPIDFRVQLRRNSYNELGIVGARVVGEPATCLAISVAFALREAITFSREDSGYPKNKWFEVDGPFTLEANVLKADAKLSEFLYY